MLNEDLLEITPQGLWWRKNDRSYQYLYAEKEIPQTISSFCSEKRVLIQAGGHCGMFVKLYSEIFNTVYTFEPDTINFYCLTKNVTSPNTIKIQGCLGNDRKLVALSENKKTAVNSGAFNIEGSGIIPTFKIDDLNLPTCDLIHLDIEGFEGFAIEGARQTINRCKPVIALEFRNFGVKYNFSDDKVRTLMSSLGYKEVGKVFNDVIFKHL